MAEQVAVNRWVVGSSGEPQRYQVSNGNYQLKAEIRKELEKIKLKNLGKKT